MDFAEKIAELQQRVIRLKDTVETEEATKNAFIMPFIQALGYDVFNPSVVIPEFTADVGKNGEKVDYAIKINDKICILIECKSCQTELCEKHRTQLYRYFTTTEARFSILTNGIQYWFYTDLDESNKMDAKPFFEFNLSDYKPNQVDELKKFTADTFNMDSILETASDLKYSSLLLREITKEIENSSQELSKLLISRVYEGHITANVFARFTPLIQKCMKETVRELVNKRLSSAIETQTTPEAQTDEADAKTEEALPDENGIVTTEEEKDAFQIVRAIVREKISADRIFMRDAKSYCAILVDNNNRKPICRFYFGKKKEYINIFDLDKHDERFEISSIDDIFKFSDKLKTVAAGYLDPVAEA